MDPSVMVVEEDGKGFSAMEVRDKHVGLSGLGDLEVPKYLTRTLWAVGARVQRIRRPGNDRSKIHAWLTVPFSSFIAPLTFYCIHHL